MLYDRNDNDKCANCKHMRKDHLSLYSTTEHKLVGCCSPKFLGYEYFCGCQKFQEPKEKRNGPK